MKRMNRHPKAHLEEILEYNNLTSSGIRVDFSLSHPPAAKLLVV
jgi:hypothetical protein